MLLVQFLFPLKMAGETLYLKLHLFHAFIICNVFFLSTCVISAPIFFKVGFILDRNRVPETDNLYLSLNYLKQKYSQDNIDFRSETLLLTMFEKISNLWKNLNKPSLLMRSRKNLANESITS